MGKAHQIQKAHQTQKVPKVNKCDQHNEKDRSRYRSEYSTIEYANRNNPEYQNNKLKRNKIKFAQMTILEKQDYKKRKVEESNLRKNPEYKKRILKPKTVKNDNQLVTLYNDPLNVAEYIHTIPSENQVHIKNTRVQMTPLEKIEYNQMTPLEKKERQNKKRRDTRSQKKQKESQFVASNFELDSDSGNSSDFENRSVLGNQTDFADLSDLDDLDDQFDLDFDNDPLKKGGRKMCYKRRTKRRRHRQIPRRRTYKR